MLENAIPESAEQQAQREALEAEVTAASRETERRESLLGNMQVLFDDLMTRRESSMQDVIGNVMHVQVSERPAPAPETVIPISVIEVNSESESLQVPHQVPSQGSLQVSSQVELVAQTVLHQSQQSAVLEIPRLPQQSLQSESSVAQPPQSSLTKPPQSPPLTAETFNLKEASETYILKEVTPKSDTGELIAETNLYVTQAELDSSISSETRVVVPNNGCSCSCQCMDTGAAELYRTLWRQEQRRRDRIAEKYAGKLRQSGRLIREWDFIADD